MKNRSFIKTWSKIECPSVTLICDFSFIDIKKLMQISQRFKTTN